MLPAHFVLDKHEPLKHDKRMETHRSIAAPDGKHFLMITQEDVNATPNGLNVVLNWTEELKRRAPAQQK